MNNLQSIHWQYELVKQRHAELLAEAAQRRLLQASKPMTTSWSTRLWRILSLRSERQVNAWLQQPESIDEALCN